MASPCAGVCLDNVTLVRGNRTVLDRLSLRLEQPRIGLIGDNGAGKSSLFRLLCGLEQPQSGRVQWGSVAGVATTQATTTAPAPVSATTPVVGQVGMMFQNPDEQIVFPTVQEELALSLRVRKLPRAQALLQARALLQERGLAHWAERAIGSLSHGQRQHVCWLAMLIAAPALLLLDEPFSSLDLPGQARLVQDIGRASQQIIVASHILAPLRQFDRVIWLERGRVRADGPAAQVCAAYEADVARRVASGALAQER